MCLDHSTMGRHNNFDHCTVASGHHSIDLADCLGCPTSHFPVTTGCARRHFVLNWSRGFGFRHSPAATIHNSSGLGAVAMMMCNRSGLVVTVIHNRSGLALYTGPRQNNPTGNFRLFAGRCNHCIPVVDRNVNRHRSDSNNNCLRGHRLADCGRCTDFLRRNSGRDDPACLCTACTRRRNLELNFVRILSSVPPPGACAPFHVSFHVCARSTHRARLVRMHSSPFHQACFHRRSRQT
mmetsp:Transcript_36396/g.82989  ORF Transcript_36396/g.82989 Transcript_36396/m.82989 type:complete len:237 (-) Transcript_36396:632-1342(-)